MVWRNLNYFLQITRHHIVEWVGHALEDKEGLISLRYFFVEVTLNGDNLGVYAIEEHLIRNY